MTFKFCPQCHKVFYWIAGPPMSIRWCMECSGGKYYDNQRADYMADIVLQDIPKEEIAEMLGILAK